jgi:hypothetical protein
LPSSLKAQFAHHISGRYQFPRLCLLNAALERSVKAPTLFII